MERPFTPIVHPLAFVSIPTRFQENFVNLLTQGEDNDHDHDKSHVAYWWVSVEFRDINDNKSLFDKANIETSVYENARVQVGKSLVIFRATDPDQGGKSKVSFAIDRASDRRRLHRR